MVRGIYADECEAKYLDAWGSKVLPLAARSGTDDGAECSPPLTGPSSVGPGVAVHDLEASDHEKPLMQHA